jgi:hypothetical protein
MPFGSFDGGAAREWRSDGGTELAGEIAEFVRGVDGEAAESSARALDGRRGLERGDGFGEIGGEGVDTDAKLDDVGGSTGGGGRMAHLVAQRLDGGANLGGVFGDERELLTFDFEDVGAVVQSQMTGDLLEGFGRDPGHFGETEIRVAEVPILLDEVIGVAAAEAGVLGAELVPGETEVIEEARFAHLLEARGAGCRATAADGGEGILETGPGAEILMFFAIHGCIFDSIEPRLGEDLLQTRELVGPLGLDRAENKFSRRVSLLLYPTLLSPTRGWRDGVRQG